MVGTHLVFKKKKLLYLCRFTLKPHSMLPAYWKASTVHMMSLQLLISESSYRVLSHRQSDQVQPIQVFQVDLTRWSMNSFETAGVNELA